MKCAERTCRFTNIGKINNPIDDKPDVIFWVCQSSSHIPGFSQINDVPGKKIRSFFKRYSVSPVYLMVKFVVFDHVFLCYSRVHYQFVNCYPRLSGFRCQVSANSFLTPDTYSTSK